MDDSDAGVSDADIISESLLNGERFAIVYRRHGQRIFGYMWRRVGTAADDLVADVFCSAFEQRDRFDLSRPSALPWLYGIATHRVSRHWRTHQRRSRATLRIAGRSSTSHPLDVDSLIDRVAATGATSELRDWLAALDPLSLDILVLAAWEELTQSEIAVALDIPVGTVKSRMSRLRSKNLEPLRQHWATTSRHDNDAANLRIVTATIASPHGDLLS